MEAWKRAIILVDMNAFFASIEQLDDASLRNKPIAVTNGAKGSCIIIGLVLDFYAAGRPINRSFS